MAVTTLDPQTALIVIDLQNGIVTHQTAHPIDGVVDNAALLAETFRRNGLPVVLVTVGGAPAGRTEQIRNTAGQLPAGWADLVPELNQQSGDHALVKKTWGAFTNTGLDEHLKNLGVTQVVRAGVATSIGVESTARHAHENGYHVTLALDAMTDTSGEAHANSVERIFPRLGETGSTQQIVDLLANTRP